MMMKAFGFWVLFLLFVTSLISLSSSSFPGYGDARMKVKVHSSRKIKEKMNVDPYDGNASKIDLLDYHRTDPVPSSKAWIRHGPIQHDAPLMPYIPGPPPSEPNDHQP